MDKEQALERLAKSYEAGTVLFNEGDKASKMWVIADGHIRLSKLVCCEEVEIEVLGPGEYCGELALLQNGPQNSTATVLDSAKLIALDSNQFEALIRSNGELAMRMLKKMAGRLNEAQFRISVLQMRSTIGRAMIQLRAETLYADKAKGAKIPENLAEHLGLDSVELEIVLNKLVDKKLIRLNDADKTYSIIDDEEYDRYLRYLELHDRYEYFNK